MNSVWICRYDAVISEREVWRVAFSTEGKCYGEINRQSDETKGHDEQEYGTEDNFQ